MILSPKGCLKKIFFLSTFIFFVVNGMAQRGNPPYPKWQFRWPVDLKPEIVANMGELRDDHWHMGLDVRTNARVNYPVYASAGGYISRIGVKPLGFGRFIEIAHPNGFSTLYAHLNDFYPALESYVREVQYAMQSWSVELTFTEKQFPVTKGQFIAYSGTTGGSAGPHVHFEIMDTRTTKRLNPQLFGMPLPDSKPPVISRLVMYNREVSTYPGSRQFFPVKKIASGYVISPDKLIKTPLSQVSFGLQAFDNIDASPNKDGIFSAQLQVDGRIINDFVLDSIDYIETKDLNAHIDYAYRQMNNTFIQHLSRLPGNYTGVYKDYDGNGMLQLDDTLVHDVSITVRDANKNSTTLNFKIQRSLNQLASSSMYPAGQRFTPGNVNVWEKENFEIYLPETALFDTVYPRFYTSKSGSIDAVSDVYTLNDNTIPIRGTITVRIKPFAQINPNLMDKLVIQCISGTDKYYRKANWDKNGWLYANFPYLGSYTVVADGQAPTVNEIGTKDTVDLTKQSRLVFTPQDNYGRPESFNLYLDGQWLRCTNDKGKVYIYTMDEHFPDGVHELRVMMQDIAGNVTERSWIVKRTPKLILEN